MPGPRLQANVSKPQAIVTSFSNAAEMQGIAQLGQLAATAYSINQASNDDATLAGVTTELQDITDQLDQGLISRKQANTMSNVVRSDAIKSNDHLLGEINQLANFNSRSFQIAGQEETAESARLIKVATDRVQDIDDAGLDITNPNVDQHLRVYRQQRQELSINQQTLDGMELNQKVERIQVKKVAFAHTQVVTTNLSNRWSKSVGTDRAAFEKMDERTISGLKTNIDFQLKDAEAEVTSKYGDTLSKDEINDMLVPLRAEAAFQLKVLSDKNFYDTYQSQIQMRNLVADKILSPTPEAKALNTLTQQLSSGNTEFFLRMVGNDDLMKQVEGNMGATMARLSGDDSLRGASALSFMENKEERSKATATMINTFTTDAIDLDDPAARGLANTLANLTKPMDLAGKDFGIEAWDAMAGLAASDNGKAILNDPRFAAARTSINSGIANYSDKLLGSAIKNLPPNTTAAIVDGAITLIAGELRPTTGLAQDSTLQQEFVTNNAIEKWRQNYGTRINTLAQGITNINTGKGDANENLARLASSFGLISAVPSTDEPSATAQLAAETAVAQGWYETVAEALKDLPNE